MAREPRTRQRFFQTNLSRSQDCHHDWGISTERVTRLPNSTEPKSQRGGLEVAVRWRRKCNSEVTFEDRGFITGDHTFSTRHVAPGVLLRQLLLPACKEPETVQLVVWWDTAKRIIYTVCSTLTVLVNFKVTVRSVVLPVTVNSYISGSQTPTINLTAITT